VTTGNSSFRVLLGHRFKIKLAARLRKQTTVTVAWIAERLRMGSRGHLMQLLYLNGKEIDLETVSNSNQEG
jgi:hypothetical protein